MLIKRLRNYVKEFWKMKFTPNPSFIFQNGKNQIYKNWGKPIMKNENEKYFLNSLRFASCHAALSSFQSSERITADMRFAPRLGAHPNCSLWSQLLISANVRRNCNERHSNFETILKYIRKKTYFCQTRTGEKWKKLNL